MSKRLSTKWTSGLGLPILRAPGRYHPWTVQASAPPSSFSIKSRASPTSHCPANQVMRCIRMNMQGKQKVDLQGWKNKSGAVTVMAMDFDLAHPPPWSKINTATMTPHWLHQQCFEGKRRIRKSMETVDQVSQQKNWLLSLDYGRSK